MAELDATLMGPSMVIREHRVRATKHCQDLFIGLLRGLGITGKQIKGLIENLTRFDKKFSK
ncbi:MAG: hypothetical protein HN825_10780 [Gammaproteobacteria bacterium]|jgi:hypothetical protein|nr:hypothetical protein [Gammaproteobacteria bacterium]